MGRITGTGGASSRIAAALVLACALSVPLNALAAPADGRGAGVWPVGLAASALVVVGARPRRLVPMALLLAVLAVAALLPVRPAGVALGYGLGASLAALVGALVLTDGLHRRWRLRSDADLLRLCAAAGAGALVGAAAGATTSALTGFGHPAGVAILLGASQAASLLVWPPLCARLPEHGDLGGRVELAAQAVLLVAVTLVVLLPRGTGPALPFLALPVLGWAALRMRPRMALLQTVALLAVAALATARGHGPFAALAPTLASGVLEGADGRSLLLAAFAAACALLVVPMVIRVGEHVDAVRAARAERDRLDAIVRSTHGVAIIGSDPLGRIDLFNPGAERLLGYAAEEVMGRPSRMLHSPREIERLAAGLGVEPDFAVVATRLMRPEHAGHEVAFVRSDGEERMHSMTLGRVLGADGEVVGHLSTSEDVTDRVRTREALEQALERMREVDAVKDSFVASASHELRTPVTSILGYLELLEDGAFGELGASAQDAVARIASNSRRLLTLVDDLLVLSRIQEQGCVPASGPVDLAAVVRAGCEVVEPASRVQGPEVRVRLPDVPLLTIGCPDQLERVVVNLVGNAVKFTPAGGRVDVVLEPVGPGDVTGDGRGHQPGEVRLRVSDTGIGIPADEVALLFTRFFRSSVAQRQAIPGSGLGLAIAHAVVRDHGGRIDVRSRLGRGTTVEVVLPAAITPAPREHSTFNQC